MIIIVLVVLVLIYLYLTCTDKMENFQDFDNTGDVWWPYQRNCFETAFGDVRCSPWQYMYHYPILPYSRKKYMW